jgi:hypothetical protein
LAAGADGLILSGSHDGLPPDQAGLDWMRPRVALLREFHATLLARPASWQTVQTPTQGLEVLKAETAAGIFLYAKADAPCSLPLKGHADGLVVYWQPEGVSLKEGSVVFEKAGEIWLGPEQWRNRVGSRPAAAEPATGSEKTPTPKEKLLSLQARTEGRFTFCAALFASLPRPLLERHLPALLPHFRKYYGEPITPLTELKSPDGKALDLGDIAIAGTAEDMTEGKKEADTLGTGGMTGQTDGPLKQRIKSVLSSEQGAESMDALLDDLKSLEDGFLNACLRWEADIGSAGRMALHPIEGSDLAGGAYIVNLSNEPVEMCLEDGDHVKEHWVSSLVVLEASPPAVASVLEKMTKRGGVRAFGKTLAADFTQGYTVVIPPGGRREIMVSKAASGQFSCVALNRTQGWQTLAWERPAAAKQAQHQPGDGTSFFLQPKPSKPLTLWSGELWRPLDTLESPPEGAEAPKALKTHLYRGEWETVGFSVHNPNDEPAALIAWPDLPLDCVLMAYAYTRAQEWTRCHARDVMLDLRFDAPDRPLPEGPTNGNLVYLNRMGEVWIPPHQTRQVFLIFKAGEATKPDVYSGQLHLVDPLRGEKMDPIALEVRVWPMALPPRTSFRGTGYSIGSAIFWPRNAQDAFEHYFNHLSLPGKQPSMTLDWEKEEIVVGEVPETEKDTDFLGCQRLAGQGFSFMFGGWGATGLKFKGGAAGFVDEIIRQKQAAADGQEAKSALDKMAKGLGKGEEEKEEKEDVDLGEDDEKKPKDEAELLREKAEQIKKKCWPGTPGYEKLTQEMYDKTIQYYLKQGFRAEQLISYVWDEPPASIFPSVVRMAKLMKEIHPEIRTHVTTLGDQTDIPDEGAFDIFTPHMGHVYDCGAAVDRVGHALPGEGRNLKNLAYYHRSCKELWGYMQHTGYIQGKHAVDYPMGLLWRAWQMNMKGFGIFSIRNCRGDLSYYPTKCYEAWREGVEDFLAVRALEADIESGRKKGVDEKALAEAETALRDSSQEVLGMQWWWSDMDRRYRVIRAARLAVAEAHLKLSERLSGK